MRARSRKYKRLTYEQKKSLYGYGFLSLWLFGSVFYLLRPLIDVIRYSFSKIENTGYGYNLLNVGIENYQIIFREDPEFLPALSEALIALAYEVPVIIIFSFLLAVLLNQKFHGRTLMRAVFFVPVIVASGVVIGVMYQDPLAIGMMSGVDSTAASPAMFNIRGFQEFLLDMNLPKSLVSPVIDAANNIYNLTWKSGIQILIFVAALQTVPYSLYEASAIDGATGWEKFWKITFPMISPMLLLVFVYSVIDSFTDANNKLMGIILNKLDNGFTELSSAMILVYMIIIVVVVVFIYVVTNRFVYYANDST